MSVLGQEAVLRIAYAAGTRGADGRFAAGATTTTIYASMQPLTGRVLQRLPEGERKRYELVAYTESVVSAGDQAAGIQADRITYSGVTYEVGRVQQWPAAGPLPHYEALLVRLQEVGGAV